MKNKHLAILLTATLLSTAPLLTACGNSETTTPTSSETQTLTADSTAPITEAEIDEVQQAWGDGILEISRLGRIDRNAAVDYASDFLDRLYGFQEGSVLFKPTKADTKPFRLTKEDALSYFVGGKIPGDHGFALEPWTDVQFHNEGYIIHEDSAIASGEYYFTAEGQDQPTAAEYTFEYFRAPDGTLKINVHHSSVHYTDKD